MKQLVWRDSYQAHHDGLAGECYCCILLCESVLQCGSSEQQNLSQPSLASQPASTLGPPSNEAARNAVKPQSSSL